jgi:L-erythro-3,5-diaminohexanoate dehydrogenase
VTVTPARIDGADAEARRLGIHRSIAPVGALPHIADVLDPGKPANEHEILLDVETLAVDATSFRAIRDHSDGDPERMAETIAEIVAEHGKLQNPWTGSGGVLLGRVRSAGASAATPGLAAGDAVVPLASLIAIPLALDDVGPVDPAVPQVPVRGRAIVTGAMFCARVPDDLPRAIALTAFDVYPAASHVRDLAAPGARVLVLGAGHGGLLALAAAREAVGPEGTVATVDVSPRALAHARAIDPAVLAVEADVTDPLAVTRALDACGAGRADLTVLCTSVRGAEGTALLASAPRATVVFFSTATRFAAAALGADAVGAQPRLLIPCGLTDDRGEYALTLLRTSPALRAAFAA